MVYNVPLKSLQGVFIPDCYQVRFAPLSMWQGFSVEDCGNELTEITLRDAEQMFECLHQVHSCNVLHGDVAIRNFVKNYSNSKVVIVDFARSKYVPDLEETGYFELEELAEEIDNFNNSTVSVDDIRALVRKYTEPKRKRRRL